MFRRLKKRLTAWALRQQQREVDRMHAKLVKLKADVLKSNGGEPIRLTPEEHQRLNERRRTIDPETLKRMTYSPTQSSVRWNAIA